MSYVKEMLPWTIKLAGFAKAMQIPSLFDRSYAYQVNGNRSVSASAIKVADEHTSHKMKRIGCYIVAAICAVVFVFIAFNGWEPTFLGAACLIAAFMLPTVVAHGMLQYELVSGGAKEFLELVEEYCTLTGIEIESIARMSEERLKELAMEVLKKLWHEVAIIQGNPDRLQSETLQKQFNDARRKFHDQYYRFEKIGVAMGGYERYTKVSREEAARFAA